MDNSAQPTTDAAARDLTLGSSAHNSNNSTTNSPPAADSERIDESVLADPKFAACLERLEAHFPKAKIKTPRSAFQKLGRFEIRRELGRGRFGVVFLAWDPQLQRQVALKVPQFDAAMDPELRERFRGEALSAGKLQHSGIVSIYDVGQHAGVDYLAMAYVDGQTLADRLQDGPLPPQEAAQLIIQLARAVQHAHEEGVIHRDLKPSNVLLDKAGEPHVTDFGLARRLSDSAMRATATGQVLGTPAYMPPEQASGQSDIGATSDVYSLGVILYETITGRPPFQAATFVEAVEFILNRDPLPPSKLNPKLPRELDAITFKCLEKRPTARYSSAAELADDLQRYLDHRPIRARSQGFLQHAVRWARRHPSQALLSLATLVLIALGVATSIVYSRWQHADALAAEQQATAETQRYYANVNDARNIIARRQQGWSERAIHQLQTAAALHSGVADRQELRQLATECLTGFDLQLDAALDTDMYIGRIATSPDGSLLAVGELKGSAACRVVVYDFAQREVLHTFTILNTGLARIVKDPVRWQDGVREFAISSDNRYLAVGMRFGSVYCYDLQNPQELPRHLLVSNERELAYMAFSADGKTLFGLTKDYEFLRWLDWRNNNSADNPLPEQPLTFRVAPFADTFYLLNHQQSNPRMLNQQLQTRQHFAPTARTPKAQERQLATDGSGALLAGISDHGLKVYETHGGGHIRRLQDDSVGDEPLADELMFSRDGRLLMTFEDSGVVRFFDVSRGQQVMRLDLPRYDFQDVAFDPERRWLVVANDRRLEFWKLKQNPIRRVLTSPAETVEDFSFSPDGKAIACVATAGIRFSPFRTSLFTFSSDTGEELSRRRGGVEHLAWEYASASLAWHADGQQILVHSISGTEIVPEPLAAGSRSGDFFPLTGPTTGVEFDLAIPAKKGKRTATGERVAHPADPSRQILKVIPNGAPFQLRCRTNLPLKIASHVSTLVLSLKIDADHSYEPPLIAHTTLSGTTPHRAPPWTWIDTRNQFQHWTITLPKDFPQINEFEIQFKPLAGVRSVEIERIDFVALGLPPGQTPASFAVVEPIEFLSVSPGGRIWGCVSEKVRSWPLSPDAADTTWINPNHSFTGAGNIRALRAGNSGTLVGTRDGRVHWLDPVTGKSRDSWAGRGKEVVAVALCEPANLALVGDEAGNVRGLSVTDGKVVFDLTADDSAIVALAATPDGSVLVTAASNRGLKLWQRDDQGSYRLFRQLPDLVSPARKLDISVDGTYLAILERRTAHVEIWNLPELTKELQRLGIE